MTSGQSLPGRILIAEDDEDVALLATTVLAEEGYEVQAVRDAEAALRRLADDASITLLLTDIRMPGALDGWRLAAAAKALRPDLRVIYMTGFASLPSEGMGHGPLLPKPWKPMQLLRCVDQALAKR